MFWAAYTVEVLRLRAAYWIGLGSGGCSRLSQLKTSPFSSTVDLPNQKGANSGAPLHPKCNAAFSDLLELGNLQH